MCLQVRRVAVGLLLLAAALAQGHGLRAQAGVTVSLSLDRSTVRAGDLIRMVAAVNATSGTLAFVDVTSGQTLGSHAVGASGNAVRLVLVDAKRWGPGTHEIEARYSGGAVSARRSIDVQVPRGNATVWGRGDSGQIGDGSELASAVNPVPVPGILPDVVAMSHGLAFTTALKSDGTVWAWGTGASGELGLGTATTFTTKPLQVPIDDVVAIASGAYHTVAIKYDNGNYTVWSWGYNGDGELGDNTTDSRFSPVQVRRKPAGAGTLGGSVSGFVAVTAGAAHSLALGYDGVVYSWGHGGWGQLGDANPAGHISTAAEPTAGAVPNLFKSIAAGGYHSLAMDWDGNVYGWGRNDRAQLGLTSSASFATPTFLNTVRAPSVAIAAGLMHSASIYADGTVDTWGDNSSGQLGNGTTDSSIPPASSHLRDASGQLLWGAAQIAAGTNFTLALRADGTLWAAGDNSHGQLGAPEGGSQSLVSVPLANPTPFLKLASGGTSWTSGAIERATIASVSGSGTYGSLAGFTATLTSADGAVAADVDVNFSANGVTVGTATTNTSGVARLTVSNFGAADPGSYPAGVGITYAGVGVRSGTATGSLSVFKGTPTITWEPLSLDTGAPLGPDQLNATANVQGRFDYQPASGTILPSGATTLSAAFYPDDTARWNPTNRSVVLHVLDTNTSTRYHALALSFPGTVSTIVDMNDSGQVLLQGLNYNQSRRDCWLFDGTAWRAFGLTDCTPYDLNAQGEAVGFSTVGNARRAFVYRAGAPADLGVGGGFSEAYAINDKGAIVGIYSTPSGQVQPFVHENGVTGDLVVGSDVAYPTAINEAGQIAGYGSFAGLYQGFLYQAGNVVTFNVPTAASTRPQFINAAGQVAGNWWGADNIQHSFLFENGTARSLDTLGAPSSLAALNASGQMTGTATLSGPKLRAFTTFGGVATDLGLLPSSPSGGSSRASSINIAGDVVGLVNVAPTGQTGFYASRGVMYDLNALLASDSASILVTNAVRLNNTGQIAALGTRSGVSDILLLTPALSSTTMALPSVATTYGASAPMTATLTSNGTPLAGRSVRFSVDGIDLGTASSNAAGVATLAAPATLPAGDHTVGVSFGGEPNYASANASGTLAISKAVPGVTVTDVHVTFDFLAHPAPATATGVFGETLAPLALSYNGKLAAPVLAGTYAVVAAFGGNGNYEPSTAGGEVIIDKAKPTITWAAAAWSLSGPMRSPRLTPGGGLLQDGRILLAGSNDFRRDAEIFDPATGQAIVTGSLNDGRCYGCASIVLRDGRVLLAGGWTGPGTSVRADAEIYDPVAGTFARAVNNMSSRRIGANIAALPDGRILVAGGHPGAGANASADIFNPATNAFTLTGSMLQGRLGSASVLADGRVLFAGGQSETGVFLASAEIFDPGTGKFTLTGSMAVARHGHSALTLADGRVLVAGGEDNGTHRAMASAELYDPVSGTWSPAGSLQTARQGFALVLMPGGEALAIGGIDADEQVLSSTELFNPSSGAFRPGPAMTIGLQAVAAFVLADGRVVVAGGRDNTGAISRTVEILGLSGLQPIKYGTPLGPVQLSAHANLDGMFVYDPPAGTILNAGLGQPLHVTFTPDDTVNWTLATATVLLDVLAATPIVHVIGGVFPYDGLPHPATVTAIGVLGETLTPVTVTYSGSADAPTAVGTYAVLATFTGSQNYEPALGSGTVTITDTVPPVIDEVSDITASATGPDGAAVSYTIPKATDNVDGTIAVDCLPAPGKTFPIGSTRVKCTAADQAGNTATSAFTITVKKAPATLTLGSLAAVFDGSPKTATVTTSPAGLTGVTVTYDGTPAAPINAGTYAVHASLDNATYSAGDVDGTFTILKATPAVTWTHPADIVYGTALGAAQLNATAAVNGTFVYSPVAGTVLHAGAGQPLSVTFTPADTANYDLASRDVTISVLRAPLTITANDASKAYGAALPAFAAGYRGFVNGDTATDVPATLSTAATSASGVGTYPIVASGAADADYDIVFVAGTLEVKRVTLTVTAHDSTKLFGAPLPAFTVQYNGFVNGDGPASLGGTLSFATAATTSSSVGTYPVTPQGLASANYTIDYAPGTLMVTYAVCLADAVKSPATRGSTIPVKLQLCGDGSAVVSSPSLVVTAYQIAPTGAGPQDSGEANPGNVFRLTGAGYLFNLQTTGLASGAYQLLIRVSGDPVIHAVPFSIR